MVENILNPDKLISIQEFDPEKRNVSDYKFILVLNERTTVIDKLTNQELKNLDGKCILIKYDNSDLRTRTDMSLTHANYFRMLFSRYRIISRKGENVIDSDEYRSRSVYNFCSLSILYGITIFYDLSFYDADGYKISDTPGSLVFLQPFITTINQYNTLKSILNKMQRENYSVRDVEYKNTNGSIFLKYSIIQFFKTSYALIPFHKGNGDNLLLRLKEAIDSININELSLLRQEETEFDRV